MDLVPVRAADQAAGQVQLDPLTRARFGLALVPVERRLVQQRLRAPAWVVADPARRRAFTAPADLEVVAVHLPGAAGQVEAGEPLLTLRPAPGASAQDLRRLRALVGDPPAGAPLVLRAPGPGLVAGPLPAAGAWVRRGEPLLEHVDLAEVLVEVELHEGDLPLAVPGSVAFFAAATPPRHHGRKRAPADRFRGTLHAHPGALDPLTRRGRAMARVENPDGLLLPGAFLEAELEVVWGSVIVVPDSAVISTGDRELVVKAGAGDALTPVEVEAGRRGEGLVEIQAGLEPGDAVVGRGAFFAVAESRLRTPFRLGDPGAP
jgi:Cu(I)/Ag(I) efflux system membrane fusion protein